MTIRTNRRNISGQLVKPVEITVYNHINILVNDGFALRLYKY